MAKDRLDLQSIFEELLGSRNVYYSPPESTKMQYDAIKYSKKNIWTTNANDAKYSMMGCYEVMVISRRPDCPVVKQLLALPYCSYDRQYIASNLYHDVLTLYF